MAEVADRVHMAAGEALERRGSELSDPFTCTHLDLRARTINRPLRPNPNSRACDLSTAATGDPTTVGGGACHERSGAVFDSSGEHATARRYAQTDYHLTCARVCERRQLPNAITSPGRALYVTRRILHAPTSPGPHSSPNTTSTIRLRLEISTRACTRPHTHRNLLTRTIHRHAAAPRPPAANGGFRMSRARELRAMQAREGEGSHIAHALTPRTPCIHPRCAPERVIDWASATALPARRALSRPA
jgi:hypothetical protein